MSCTSRSKKCQIGSTQSLKKIKHVIKFSAKDRAEKPKRLDQRGTILKLYPPQGITLNPFKFKEMDAKVVVERPTEKSDNNYSANGTITRIKTCTLHNRLGGKTVTLLSFVQCKLRTKIKIWNKAITMRSLYNE